MQDIFIGIQDKVISDGHKHHHKTWSIFAGQQQDIKRALTSTNECVVRWYGIYDDFKWKQTLWFPWYIYQYFSAVGVKTALTGWMSIVCWVATSSLSADHTKATRAYSVGRRPRDMDWREIVVTLWRACAAGQRDNWFPVYLSCCQFMFFIGSIGDWAILSV